MICAETFGCSGKTTYSETRSFAEYAGLAGLGNFSNVSGFPLIASIDRVSRCALDWAAFADIAISHASRDIEVGLGTPSHALVCFEFGEDASPNDRVALVRSVAEAVGARNIQLGKCHSVVTSSDVTSLVVALIGEGAKRNAQPDSQGLVWISGPLGFAKLLYLEGLKREPVQHEIAAALSRPLELHRFASLFTVMSDVSGHALAGCLCDLAERYSVEIDVTISRGLAASDEAIAIPASLFENDIEDYSGATLAIANGAKCLALLKETAGPIIAFSGELSGTAIDGLRSNGWRAIGSFRTGSTGVSIQWSE